MDKIIEHYDKAYFDDYQKKIGEFGGINLNSRAKSIVMILFLTLDAVGGFCCKIFHANIKSELK